MSSQTTVQSTLSAILTYASKQPELRFMSNEIMMSRIYIQNIFKQNQEKFIEDMYKTIIPYEKQIDDQDYNFFFYLANEHSTKQSNATLKKIARQLSENSDKIPDATKEKFMLMFKKLLDQLRD